MLVSKAKFLQYQKDFYQKIKCTPYKIGLEIVQVIESVPADDFNITEFVGDRVRESKIYKLRCLYEKEISPRTREKYGLPIEVNGIVYLSPLQLKPILGDYHLDWNTTKIHFAGRVQVIDRIYLLEEFVEYKNCIGLQIFVKDELKGG